MAYQIAVFSMALIDLHSPIANAISRTVVQQLTTFQLV